MRHENLTIHLERGDTLVYLSPPIATFRQYFSEEEKLAQFLVRTYPHFRRFRAVGVAQSWIRDEEFEPHIRADIEWGYTPHLGAVHRMRREEQMYLKTILPDDQIARMSRSQKMRGAWGTDAEHRSGADIKSAIIAFLFGKE